MGGLEVVDPRYAEVWRRARTVLEADPRVQRVELGGSVAAGTADEWSDLDLQVVVAADDHAGFLAEWPQWLAAITPTVFARTPISPFIINTLTPDGLTVDIAVWAGEVPPFAPGDQYHVGMLSSRRFDDVGDALAYAVEEQLRGLAGPFVSLIQREEHVRHLAGVPHILGLLTTVFLAETEAPPPAKHWNRTFTEEQRAAVAGLPPVSATREGIIAFGLGLAELLVRRARPLYPRFGLEWPAPLAAATAARLESQLGIDARDWLH
ncbi:MAG TPA: nucleotidyltransferase domain-containing protein [Acidimicrobiales bacterium]|nr:nucleotidyltransferase domain-containing protein [Acidimicrobiales bacterium]